MCCLRGPHICCLWSLLAFGDFKSDSLSFFERFKTLDLDRAVVNKGFLAIVLRNKTKTFAIVKPFDGAADLLGHGIFYLVLLMIVLE